MEPVGTVQGERCLKGEVEVRVFYPSREISQHKIWDKGVEVLTGDGP